MIARWQKRVGRTVDENPTKWAMLSPKQRKYLYGGFMAGYEDGAVDGEVTGEDKTEQAAAVLAAFDTETIHNWAVGYLKHKGVIRGYAGS